MEEETRWLKNEEIFLKDEKMLAFMSKMEKDENIQQVL